VAKGRGSAGVGGLVGWNQRRNGSFGRLRALSLLSEVRCGPLIFTGALYELLTGHLVCRGVNFAPGLGGPCLIATHFSSITRFHPDPLAARVFQDRKRAGSAIFASLGLRLANIGWRHVAAQPVRCVYPL
jgi:hypothetical protein